MSDQDREQVKIKANDEETTDDVEAHVKSHGPFANDEGTDGDDDVQAHVKSHGPF